MLQIRKAAERGHFDFGWLDTFHSFSFGEYYDPAHMGFRALRVINEDRVEPGAGFPTHGHRDMEIVTYVLAGALEHKDSIGTGSIIRPGELQRMSAGRGVQHSEFNASKTEPVHLLQIWILPERSGAQPEYEQKRFDLRNDLRLIASHDGRAGSVTIHQDAALYAARPTAGTIVRHELAKARHAWLQIAKGEIEIDGSKLVAGDGGAVSNVAQLELHATQDAEFLLFDLA
ncbi:MAG: pirin family protein [Planctomycetes bacterium]|nr:pirin family protein [Planctomycetota bacterium]